MKKIIISLLALFSIAVQAQTFPVNNLTAAGHITAVGNITTSGGQFIGAGTGLTGTAAGLSIGGSAGSVTTIPNLTGVITSSGNATSTGSQTGTGNTFVMSVSPVLTTPNLGTPSALIATNATGTATSLNIGGNAATATNVPYSGLTGSVPTWNQNTTGNAATATSATTSTTATNLSGGGAGTIPYQTGSGATSQLAAGTSGYVLQSNGTAAPSWVAGAAYTPSAVAITGGSITGTTISGSTGAFNQVTVNPASATMTEFQVGSGSTTLAGIYIGNDVSGYGAIWPTVVSPTSTNYAFAAGAVTYLNNLSSVVINIANSPIITVSADTATIKGTVLGGAVPAGEIGEYTQSTYANLASISNSAQTVQTLNLSSGYWEVMGTGQCSIANSGPSAGAGCYMGLNTTSGALGSGGTYLVGAITIGASGGSHVFSGSLPRQIINVTTTTPIYCVIQGLNTTSGSANCIINALRVH